MLTKIIKETEIEALRKVLAESERIVITCHVSPDGDAIGSSLALYHLLRDLGKNVNVITPDMPLLSLRFLQGWKEIIPFTKYGDFGTQLIHESDLIFCLDFNSLYRVDRMRDTLMASKARKVLIDHHLGPEPFADVMISYPKMSSTCELLFRVICRLGLFNEVSRTCAECITTGMMTDTGNFSYNSNNPDLYIILSELIKKGVDKDRIYTLAMNTSSEDRVRLLGYAMSEKMKVFPEYKAALITLTQDELQRFNYRKGDTESLVNIPLSIPEVQWSVFMREEPEYIKVSARSQGEFAVNRLCETYFSGGGHKNAAGGEYRGSMQQAIDTYMSILDTLKK